MSGERKETSVCILTCGNYILLLKRKVRLGDPWSGDMCFPGGFIKQGESPREAAERELHEETSVGKEDIHFISKIQIFHPVRFPEINVYPFLFSSEKELPVVVGDEMERGGWYKIGEEIQHHDDTKGDFLEWNNDIVWGLTFRIYSYLIQNHLIGH